jgi:hypothetical protein
MGFKRQGLATGLSSLVILSLLAPAILPAADALTQQPQYSVKVLSVSVSGDTGNTKVEVNGISYIFNATISATTKGDPTVYVGASYASYPVYVGNPPYAAWWNGISNPPEIYVYLDPGTAFNAGNSVAAIAAFIAILGAIPAAGIVAAVGAGVVALLSLDYNIIYQADHSSDGSLSLWIPADWVNIIVLFEGSHDLYVATPNYWWLCIPGLAFRSNR